MPTKAVNASHTTTSFGNYFILRKNKRMKNKNKLSVTSCIIFHLVDFSMSSYILTS